MFSFDFYLVYIIYVVKSYSARQYQNNNLCIMTNVTGDRIRRQSTPRDSSHFELRRLTERQSHAPRTSQ